MAICGSRGKDFFLDRADELCRLSGGADVWRGSGCRSRFVCWRLEIKPIFVFEA